MDFRLKIKALISSVFTVCLTACGGTSSGTDSEVEATPLPEVNTSLDTQTPEGIWLVDIIQTSHYTSKAKTDLNYIKDVQQLLVIEEQVDGTYSMPDCGVNQFKELKAIPLNVEGGLVNTSGTNDIVGNSEETYAVQLSFEDNLKLSGIIDVIRKNVTGELFYTDEITTKISAVKVSDSTSFGSAEELSNAFNAQVNNGAVQLLSDLVSPINCFSVSTASSIGTQFGQASSSKSEAVYITDDEGNTASFRIENTALGEENIADKSYFSSLSSLQGQGAVSCAADDTDCSTIKSLSFDQGFIKEKSRINGITADIHGINEKNESLKLKFVLEIK
jgi:hypothetical protein